MGIVQLAAARVRSRYVVVAGALALSSLGALAGCQLFAFIDAPLADGASDAGSDATTSDAGGEVTTDGGGRAGDARAEASGGGRGDATADAGLDGGGDTLDAFDASLDGCAVTQCTSTQVCSIGLCCVPATTEGVATGVVAWLIDWTLQTQTPVSTLEVAFTIGAVSLGQEVNADLLDLDGQIDDQRFGLGLVTQVVDGRPDASGNLRRAVTLTLVGTGDVSLVSPVEPSWVTGDQWARGVTLGRDYEWSLSDYRARIERVAMEAAPDGGVSDRFRFIVRDVRVQVDAEIGSFLVRRNGGQPASIAPTLQQYAMLWQQHPPPDSGFFAVPYADVPRFQVDTMLAGDGLAATRAQLTYDPRNSLGAFPNSDVFYDPKVDKVSGALGAQTPRCHDAGPLFTR